MAISTIADYYKYSIFSTAAYVRLGSSVRLGNSPTDGASFVREAASADQGRIPGSLGTALFNPPNNAAEKWIIRRYFRNDLPTDIDPIAAQDKSGLGAILFQQGENGDRVLAITGTESATGGEVISDVLGADLSQIGVLGLALTQVIAGVNLIERMRAVKNASVEQIRIRASLTAPTFGDYMTVVGVLPMYLSFYSEAVAGVGSGELLDTVASGKKITITGRASSILCNREND